VAEGLRARIEPQGITGLNYIEINFVDPRRFPPLAIDWKPRAYYIPSAPGELTNFLDSINNIMREVEELNIGGMTQSGTELLENLNQSITDARIGQLSGDLQTLFVDLKAAVDAAKLGDLSADARRLIGQLESSNRELGRVLRNLEPATRLPPGEVQKLVSSLTQTARNLEEFSSEVRRRPSLLLWGTAPSPTPEPAKGRVRVVPKAESPR
jgi:ABC-type transporter Mla subunit MlaD